MPPQIFCSNPPALCQTAFQASPLGLLDTSHQKNSSCSQKSYSSTGNPRTEPLHQETEMRRVVARKPNLRNNYLFVSAILSLISILISPVLSTDAMWNVISAETGTGTDAA